MYDVLTIATIVDELTAVAVGARIQQVLQVDDLTIALEIYASHRRRWLVVSAHPERARVHLSERRVDGDAERVTPLLLLLRKYARGGRIAAISQPRYERIVQVSIAKPLEATNRSDDGDDDEDDGSEELDLTYTELYVELMGRRSNIILTNQDARILDAVKRVSPEMSRVRPIRPGMQYTPPPPQDKSDPLRAAQGWMIGAVRESNETVAKWLVSQFLGISPLVAREIAVRADVEASRRAAEIADDEVRRIADATRSLFAPLSTGDWNPVLYSYDDGRALFYAFPLLSVEGEAGVARVDVDSIFTAADRASQTASAGVAASGQRHAVRRERLVAEIDEARARASSRLRSLREQVERAQEAESHRRMGEAIYVAFSDIQPGQTELRTEDGLTIPLDPSLSPSQNAQEYFERYRKAQAAEENLPELIEAAEHSLAYLDQLRSMAQLADGYDEIEAVRLEWLEWVNATSGQRAATKQRGPRPSKQSRRPRSYRTSRGDTIYLGRTGAQNDEVTFDIAGPNDLWLHARNMPGAHVIVRSSGDPDDRLIETAAALAAWYSDGRLSTAVPVDVTERRYVRKIKGAGPGMVTYRNERTLNVRPLPEGDLGLSPS